MALIHKSMGLLNFCKSGEVGFTCDNKVFHSFTQNATELLIILFINYHTALDRSCLPMAYLPSMAASQQLLVIFSALSFGSKSVGNKS